MSGDQYSQKTDSELVAAVRSGDDLAFNALFLRWYSRVEQFLLKLVREPALAEDLTQGVFMKVWLYRDRLEPSRSLGNYLFVLARNAALDVFKSKRHLVMADISTPPPEGKSHLRAAGPSAGIHGNQRPHPSDSGRNAGTAPGHFPP